MRVEVYTSDKKEVWDNFVQDSKNGTFLFLRDFMEYHADRFCDHSLLFYSDDELLGLMPANVVDQTFYTHQGLTYGGLITHFQIGSQQVLEMFDCLLDYLKTEGFQSLIYKAIPHIYHQLPAEEDLYALFRCNAELIQRNLSSALIFPNSIEYSKTRRRGLLKADKNDLRVVPSNDLETFWQILSANLKEKYNTLPVHSLEEISSLKKRFDNKIRLYSVLDTSGRMLGGCLTFETNDVTHAQYTAGTDLGKEAGAIDAVIDYIIKRSADEGKRYFDYGTSTENGGLYLNQKLIYQKEGFGCRGIVYDIYRIQL